MSLHRLFVLMTQDVYDGDTDELEETNAMESSLCELEVLSEHSHVGVRALAEECGREG